MTVLDQIPYAKMTLIEIFDAVRNELRDAYRLKKGVEALFREEPTDELLDAEIQLVDKAIAGLQSTDDESPAFTATHDRLQERYRKLLQRYAALEIAKP